MVLDPNWPITRYGQDLNKAWPQAVQNPAGAFVLTPSLVKLPFNGGASPSGFETVVTTSPYDVTTEVLLLLNRIAATTLNFPTIANRVIYTGGSTPITIIDMSGTSGDVICNRGGSDTIMGLTSAILSSNGQGAGTAAVVTFLPIVSQNMWIQVA